MKEDHFFIAGNFSNVEIPKTHRFLTKYFKTKIQKIFLKYYWVTRDWKNFVDHTGYFCTERYLRDQAHMFNKLMEVFEMSSGKLNESDMLVIQRLNEGKYKI